MLLNQDQKEILLKLYQKLEFVIRTYKVKILHNSLLLSLYNLTTKRLSIILNQASLSILSFGPKQEIDFLQVNQFIKRCDDKEKLSEYVLTVQGIWTMDQLLKGTTENDLIKYIETSKFVNENVNQSLSEKEKLIISILLSIRAFSKNVTMTLKNEDQNEPWKVIAQKNLLFLQKMEIVSSSLILEKKGHEDEVSYFMRRANELSVKTNHVFNNSGGSVYFLDVDDDTNDIEKKKDRLTYLFKKIFTVIPSPEEFQKIEKFYSSFALEFTKYISTNFSFTNPDWDDLICDSIKGIYY